MSEHHFALTLVCLNDVESSESGATEIQLKKAKNIHTKQYSALKCNTFNIPSISQRQAEKRRTKRNKKNGLITVVLQLNISITVLNETSSYDSVISGPRFKIPENGSKFLG